MSENRESKTSWILWPFKAIWDLLATILGLTGRLIAAALGFILMIVGIILSMSVIAIPVGIPFIIFGFLLMLRSIF